MIRQTFLLVVASSFLVPAIASAEAAFQFALPGRNFPEDPEADTRISMFWGNNDRVRYFDFGLGAVSQTNSTPSSSALATSRCDPGVFSRSRR